MSDSQSMSLILQFSIWHWHILKRDEFEIADLKGHFGIDRPAFIYFILSKNRISIRPDSATFTDTYLKADFIIHNKDNQLTEQLEFKHPYTGLKELKVVSEYPHNSFSIVDEVGSSLIKGKASYILEHPDVYEQVKNKDLLDYEILYIGQSVLGKNNTPVLNRITAHKTFQKILEDYNASHPDKELFSFFLSLKQDVLIDIKEPSDEERNTFLESFQRNYLNSSIREVRQNVGLLEAILINYFKPKYNSDFVRNPPGKNHSSFSEINKMNLKQVNILLGLENFLPKFYTETVKRASEYKIEYSLI